MHSFKKILIKFFEILLISVLAALLVLSIWQVFTRYVLSTSSVYTEEILRFLLVWSTLLGASYGFLKHDHLSLTFLEGSIPYKLKPYFRILIYLFVLIFVVSVLILGGYRLLSNGGGQVTSVLRIPYSYLYVVLPFSGIIITVIQIGHISDNIRILLKRHEGDGDES